MHIYCSVVRSHSAAPESNKQNPRDRTLDLSIFFCYKQITSFNNLPSPAPKESLPYWFQGNFAASSVLNFCLREFLLSAFANRFELRCEPRRMMLLYFKICPFCCVEIVRKRCRDERSSAVKFGAKMLRFSQGSIADKSCLLSKDPVGFSVIL